MEVTTVSPSPASPTEGDDLCQVDVSNVAIHSVALLICLCGLAGNGAVLRILSLKAGSFSILHLAVADFLILLFTVPSALLFLVEDLSCSPIVPFMYVSFVFQLSQLSYFWALFRLMLSNSVANILDLCKLCCGCDIPLCLWWLVNGVQYWAFALFTVIPTLTSLCPSHEQEHCQAALISMYVIILLLFAAPVFIIPTINIIRARRGSRKPQPKRPHIIVSHFVLFTLLLGLCNFLQQLGYIPVSIQAHLLLTCIYSSIKPFIYFLAGSCSSPCSMESLQLSLQRLFEEKKGNPACSDDANPDTVI